MPQRNGAIPMPDYEAPAVDNEALVLRLSTRQILIVAGTMGSMLTAVAGAGWMAIPATVARVDEGVKALQISVGQLAQSADRLTQAVEVLQTTERRAASRPQRPRAVAGEVSAGTARLRP